MIINVIKPYGVKTSSIYQHFKKFHNIKVGHAGTLDIHASGIITLLFNNATKISNKIINTKKTYFFSVMLFIKTVTGDIFGEKQYFDKEGAINKKVTNEDINKILKINNRYIIQHIPYTSNKKVKGKRMIKYKNKTLINNITKYAYIYDIKLIHKNDHTIDFVATVGSGFYIRAFSSTIGDILNTYATVVNIYRISEGGITTSKSIKIISKEY